MNVLGGVSLRFMVLAAAHAGGIACGFVSTLIMVRALGPAGFGHVALALTIVTYATITTNFGTDLHAVQSTASDRSKLQFNLTAVMLTRAMLSLPVFGVIAILSLSGIWESDAVLAILLFSLSMFINVAYPLWAPQALERVGIVALCTLAMQALNLVFVLIALFVRSDIVGFALAKVGADLLVAFGLFLWVRFYIGGRFQFVALSKLRSFLRNTAPIGGSQILRSLSIGSDILLLSFYVSATLIGYYAVSHRIFTMLLSVSSVYSIIVFPIFAKQANEGSEALHQTLRRLLHIPLPLVILGVVVIAMIARPALVLLFGPEFVEGTTSLQFLMIAVAANFMYRSYRQILLSSGRQRKDLQMTTIATVVNLSLKAVLIPFLGIVGVAIGTAIGEVLLLILQRRAALRIIRVSES